MFVRSFFLFLFYINDKKFHLLFYIKNAKRTKENKAFWKLNEQKENINAKRNLLEEKSRLDIMQAMTQAQVSLIVQYGFNKPFRSDSL